MDDRSSCPSEMMLRDFLAGRVPEGEGDIVAVHLEQCSHCEKVVEQLRKSGSAFVSVSLEVSVPTSSDPFAATRTHAADSSLVEELEHAEERFDYSLLSASQRPEALGRLGKYEVLREMGHGGYGVVFEGWDEQLQRRVAMKLLNRELSSSPVARRRFLREARAAAAINHPNVVTIHAVEEHSGIPFLVMELVNGGSLKDRIRSGQKPNVFDVLRIGAQVAAGLAAAHAQGVIHRDIKPANILLEDGLQRVKITDFGLARVAVENVDLTSREVAVGTPTYMSPEQVAGAAVDKRTDLFSLGCVLYAMFSGHSPFHGRTALEVAGKIAYEEPTLLHVIDPSVPKFLSDIVHRLLAKSPDQRFQSAAELSDVMNNHLALLNQTPSDELDAVLQKSIYRPVETSRWKHVGIRGGLAAATLAILILLVVFWPRLFGNAANTNSNNSSQTKKATTRPPVSPTIQRDRKALVTVSQSETADCKSLSEALELVSPKGEIQVLDDGEYDEEILIDDAARWAGVRLVALQGAVLKASDGGTLLAIHETPELTVRGFRFKLTNHQHGIEVTGDCHGLLLENLSTENIPTATGGRAFLYFHAGAAGTQQQPMAVRNLELIERAVGVVIGTQQRAKKPVKWVEVEGCKILGATDQESTLCVLFGGIEHVTIRRCLFAFGGCAISIAPASGNTAPIHTMRDITIDHCTMYDLEYNWLRWKCDFAKAELIQFSNNLIARSGAADFADATSKQVAWFMNNYAEYVGTDAPNGGLLTKPIKTHFLSTDVASPNFLEPDIKKLEEQISAGSKVPGAHAPETP